jgi:hypothetical protein
MATRSVAKADVAELSAALDSAVDQEKEHHLVIVSTNKVLSTTQFKQMFYSRGDDFFQIANVYECPDSCDSVHSSVWGIDCKNPWTRGAQNTVPGSATQPALGLAANLVTMGGNRLTTGGAANLGYSIARQQCFNFNKLGGRENDPPGCAWAYSYVHDQSRNFYAQHEVMGYLEKDTCVKRDFWTACSRMSIEDQLYGLAFASETDQDLCMAVTCARRWSEVEDALAESCTAADRAIKNKTKSQHKFYKRLPEWKDKNNVLQPFGLAQGDKLELIWNGVTYFTMTANIDLGNGQEIATAINTFATNGGANPHQIKTPAVGWSLTCAEFGINGKVVTDGAVPAESGYPATSAGNAGDKNFTFDITLSRDTCNPFAAAVPSTTASGGVGPAELKWWDAVDEDGEEVGAYVDYDGVQDPEGVFVTTIDDLGTKVLPTYVDLYINVRVTNGHPKALDTILRVRFTVGYTFHVPSALWTWNTRASTASSGVINSGVVGDAPEGGKQQHEDTTVVA